MTKNNRTPETISPELPKVSGEWFEDNVGVMPLAVTRRYQFDFVAAIESGNLPEDQRVEIERALRAIESHLDSILPKMPASFEDHDHSVGDRARRNWPMHLPQSMMNIHLHMCELVDAWRMNPLRLNQTSRIFVDMIAEGEGRTKFEFDRVDDRDAFIKHYEIENFVVQRGNFTEGGCFVILTNRFLPQDANEFLTIYRGCINRLSVIADERRRAVIMDGGKVGFVTIDHFITREAIEMGRIMEARKRLGAGRNFVRNEDDQ